MAARSGQPESYGVVVERGREAQRDFLLWWDMSLFAASSPLFRTMCCGVWTPAGVWLLIKTRDGRERASCCAFDKRRRIQRQACLTLLVNVGGYWLASLSSVLSLAL